MRGFRRAVVWSLILLVLLWAGGKLFLRSQRGNEWVAARVGSVLSMDAKLGAADLRFPLVLWLFDVELSGRAGGQAGTVETLRVHEARLGWRGRLRLSAELRGPELTLAYRDGRWEPLALSPLSRVEDGLQEALERVSLRFREQWDWKVRDGRVWTRKADGDPQMLLRGLYWEGLRLRLPDRHAWYQVADLYDWRGGPTNAVDTVRFEWLSTGAGNGRSAALQWNPMMLEHP